MASYRKVSCAFWDGELAEALRGDADALAVAFYLMTNRSANAIGCYRLSLAQISDDTGLDSRRASEALRKLSERAFIRVDERFRMVFIVEAARHEWGERPNPSDNRVKGLVKMLPDFMGVCRKSFVWYDFLERYREPWAPILEQLDPAVSKGLGRAPEGLPKGFSRARQDQDQESEQEQEEHPSDVVDDADASADPPEPDPPDPQENGTLPMKWCITDVWEAHLEAREIYWREREYQKPPGGPPALTAARRRLIGDAIRRHDRLAREPGDQETWTRESRARAAGRGLFLDKWLTAHDPNNRAGEGGKKYLEPERAWKIHKGIDQVDKHAEAYFEHRQRREAMKATPAPRACPLCGKPSESGACGSCRAAAGKENP